VVLQNRRSKEKYLVERGMNATPLLSTIYLWFNTPRA
jgi:hypothetical protein